MPPNTSSVETDELTLEEVAHHEAGHAVAACMQGLSVVEVTISPSPGELGHCLLRSGSRAYLEALSLGGIALTCAVVRRAEAQIMTSLAGRLAQAKYLGVEASTLLATIEGPPGVGAIIDEPDYHNAVGVAMALCTGDPDEASLLMQLLNYRARGVVHNPLRWRQIQHVAKVLLQGLRLSGHDVRQLMYAATALQFAAGT